MAKYKDFNDYINQSQPFAQPILQYLRKLIHDTHPELEEEFKWSFLAFTLNGRIIVSMASFKEHVAFGFWLGEHMKDPYKIFVTGKDRAMGQLGKIQSIEDLPERKILEEYIAECIQLSESGKKITTGKKNTKTPQLVEPDYFTEQLESNINAFENYNTFSASKKRDYIEWLMDAKTEATRNKRLTQAIEWISEGKPRNWKYMKEYK